MRVYDLAADVGTRLAYMPSCSMCGRPVAVVHTLGTGALRPCGLARRRARPGRSGRRQIPRCQTPGGRAGATPTTSDLSVAGSGAAPAAESGDGASRYTGRFDDHVFGERLQRGQDELRVDASTAVIVGGGDLVGALEAGGEVFEVVGFFSDVADGEIAHRPSTEESSGFAAAGLAVGAEALGFAFAAVEGDDVAHASLPGQRFCPTRDRW